jgi:hypothetical protein
MKSRKYEAVSGTGIKKKLDQHAINIGEVGFKKWKGC